MLYELLNTLGPIRLTPSTTQRLLENLGHRPNKKLGQHFLIDANIARKSLAFAQVTAGESIIEIGAGLGALTLKLLEAGATVYAVEYDPVLALYLRRTLIPLYGERFRLCEGDALKYPLGLWEEESIGKKPFKIVANLPYAIATPWLDAVLSNSTQLPCQMVLMVQQEAAQRLTAPVGSKHNSALALALTAAYDRETMHRVSPRCFYPEPKVDNVLVKLHRKAAPFRFKAPTRNLMRTFFIHRRKQIQTLCRNLPAENRLLEDWLKQDVIAYGIPSKVRPEALSLDCWKRLDNRFQKR